MDPYSDTLRSIGERARALRILRSLQQKELAQRAGVTRGTVVRFENTGRTSMENVVRIATVLGAEDGIAALFLPPKYRSLDEAMERPTTRRRVRKHRARTR